ncbi:MAG: ABC transporter permease [Eubacteriales bacterium]|jgi:ribose transport system permease protein
MSSKQKILKKVPGIAWATIGIFVVLSITTSGFFTSFNLMSLLRDCCVLILVSMGMHLTILSGKLNIAVGAIMSFCGVVTELALQDGMNVFLAILLGLAAGTFIGWIAGILIAYLNFDFWVITYAFMGISQGLALVISGGNTVPGSNSAFSFLGTGKIGGVYTIIWLTVIVCAIMIYISYSTKFGNNIYAIGGNVSSASLSGINVKKTIVWIFTFSGILSALSGILLAAKTNSASPIGGSGYEFDAIAAVLIGGTPFSGGRGNITYTMIGAIMMRLLRNGLNLIGLSPYWQTFIIGLLVMGIIVVDVIVTEKAEKKRLRRVYQYDEKN